MASGGHVAVLDDYPDSAQMLVACLLLSGIPASCDQEPRSRAGEHSLPACLAASPALVIYDVKPPYATALEAFRTLRETAFARVPVVITTTDTGLLGRLLRPREVAAVLLKPCDLLRVLETVRAAVGREQWERWGAVVPPPVAAGPCGSSDS